MQQHRRLPRNINSKKQHRLERPRKQRDAASPTTPSASPTIILTEQPHPSLPARPPARPHLADSDKARRAPALNDDAKSSCLSLSEPAPNPTPPLPFPRRLAPTTFFAFPFPFPLPLAPVSLSPPPPRVETPAVVVVVVVEEGCFARAGKPLCSQSDQPARSEAGRLSPPCSMKTPDVRTCGCGTKEGGGHTPRTASKEGAQ